MRYIKLCDASGLVVGAEKLENPAFVKYIRRNDIFVGCLESQAQGIVSTNGNSIYIINNSNLQSIKDDIVLSAFFIDEDEYERIMFLIEENENPSDNNSELNNTEGENISDDNNKSEMLTLAQVVVQLNQLERQVSQMSLATPVNDEATTKFYETLSSTNTNSIAKIRQAAQQYLDDTSSIEREV